MIWVQISEILFLFPALPGVLARILCTLAVLGYEGQEVVKTRNPREREAPP